MKVMTTSANCFGVEQAECLIGCALSISTSWGQRTGTVDSTGLMASPSSNVNRGGALPLISLDFFRPLTLEHLYFVSCFRPLIFCIVVK